MNELLLLILVVVIWSVCKIHGASLPLAPHLGAAMDLHYVHQVAPTVRINPTSCHIRQVYLQVARSFLWAIKRGLDDDTMNLLL